MPTKDQQVKTVVEGLALGVLALGVESVTSEKLSLDFALTDAWRKWTKASKFPSINGYYVDDMLRHGIHKSERRVGVCAAWDSQQWTSPYVMYEGWTVADCLDNFAGDGISVADWTELASHFVDHFNLKQVRRV